jgi:DNA-binding transcriptional LysR family regulator
MESMPEVNLRSLDLNLLVLLDALITHQSVTKAALAANMSQPAMSRALGRLRVTLGDPILARGADGFVATPRALALRHRLKAVLAEVAGLVTADQFSPSEWRGSVTIAATDHQTITLLPTLMARIHHEAPCLDLKVVPMLAPMMADLQDGRIHLAFGIAELALPPGLCAEPLYEDTFVTLLRQEHPARRAWTLERFLQLDHVLVTVLGDGRGVLDDDLERIGLKRRIALRLPHFYAAMTVVAGSDLIVTLPRSIAVRHTKPLRLIALKLPLERAPFTTTVIWPRVMEADPGVQWLKGLIVEQAAHLHALGFA